MAHDQRPQNAALAQSGMQVTAYRPLVIPAGRWLRGADTRQVIGEGAAVRGEQRYHVPPRVRGLRPAVQQDHRDRPAAVLDHAQAPIWRLPAAGIVSAGVAPTVIADHVPDYSQTGVPGALINSGETRRLALASHARARPR